MELHQEVASRLATSGQRYTRTRRRLVDILARAGMPLALPDIVRGRKNLPQSSAYRNLAELEARHAVEDMYGLDPPPIVHEAQSAIYFLSPEVAAVGLDEQMARAKGIPYRAAIVSNALNRRNLAMRAPVGFEKSFAANREVNR